MKTLLRIDASIRQEQSHSRELAAHFQTRWLQKTPGGNIIYRDLAKDAPPHISRQLIDAFFAEKGDPQLLALSDQYIAEWKAGDTILISTPMYNLSFPSTLKAYIDHLVRINQTFAFVPGSGYKGLLQGKQAFIIIAKGGFYKGVGQAPPDFLGKYLEGMLRFMGIEEIQLFVMEGTQSPDHAAIAMPEAKEEIDGFLV